MAASLLLVACVPDDGVEPPHNSPTVVVESLLVGETSMRPEADSNGCVLLSSAQAQSVIDRLWPQVGLFGVRVATEDGWAQCTYQSEVAPILTVSVSKQTVDQVLGLLGADAESHGATQRVVEVDNPAARIVYACARAASGNALSCRYVAAVTGEVAMVARVLSPTDGPDPELIKSLREDVLVALERLPI